MNKYLISEAKLDNLITNYIDELFPMDKLHWTHPEEFDYDEMESYENPNVVEYYFGDYNEDDNCFRWYSCDYFGPAAQSVCPLVVLEPQYVNTLNGYFNNKWETPFKRWFIEKFNLPVKSID